MTEQKRSRRRRGRRGAGARPQVADPASSAGDAAADGGAPAEHRPARRDNRRPKDRQGDALRPNGPPGPRRPGDPAPAAGLSIRRAPVPDATAPRRPRIDERGARRGESDRSSRRGGFVERPRDGDGQRPRRDDGSRSRSGEGQRPRRDEGPRVFETPVPQDPRSVELGAAFREAQMVMRDARKALDKRRAEYNDEPEWLVEQLAAAEAAFAARADDWAAHLETTGRKVARNR